MNIYWEIQTYTYSSMKPDPNRLNAYVVDEINTGTYWIKRNTLEEAIKVLRNKTQDSIKSAEQVLREILY